MPENNNDDTKYSLSKIALMAAEAFGGLNQLQERYNRMAAQFEVVLGEFIDLRKDVKFDIAEHKKEMAEKSPLDEIIVIENGKRERKSVKEILIDSHKYLEPIRFIYDALDFLKRHKIIRAVFIFLNFLFMISLLGFVLTGKGFLELIGLLQ